MDQSTYRSLLQEVRQDIANAENTIKQLHSLEDYLVQKMQGEGGAAAPLPKLKAEPVERPVERAPERKGNSRMSRAEATEVGGGGGMQTVEFGPDGFPST